MMKIFFSVETITRFVIINSLQRLFVELLQFSPYLLFFFYFYGSIYKKIYIFAKYFHADAVSFRIMLPGW